MSGIDFNTAFTVLGEPVVYETPNGSQETIRRVCLADNTHGVVTNWEGELPHFIPDETLDEMLKELAESHALQAIVSGSRDPSPWKVRPEAILQIADSGILPRIAHLTHRNFARDSIVRMGSVIEVLTQWGSSTEVAHGRQQRQLPPLDMNF